MRRLWGLILLSVFVVSCQSSKTTVTDNDSGEVLFELILQDGSPTVSETFIAWTVAEMVNGKAVSVKRYYSIPSNVIVKVESPYVARVNENETLAPETFKPE